MPKGIVGTYDHELNFWEMHPLFLTVPEFKKLHGRDRSAGKNKSSLIMWALVIVYDTGDDNPFRNLSTEDRLVEIATNILEKPNFEWEKYDYVKDKLIPMLTTPAQRQRDDLYAKMDERGKFIRETSYSWDRFEEVNGKNKLVKGTADQLDKMITASVKLYDDLSRIDKLIRMDDAKESNKELSESEEGLI